MTESIAIENPGQRRMNQVALFFTTYKDVITGVASGLTALFAWQAVNSYKGQINYQANKGSAEEVMLALIALRQTIDTARCLLQRGDIVETRKKQHNAIAEAHNRYARDCSRFKIRTRIDLCKKYPNTMKCAKDVCLAIEWFLEDKRTGDFSDAKETYMPDLTEKNKDDKWKKQLDDEYDAIEKECWETTQKKKRSPLELFSKLPLPNK